MTTAIKVFYQHDGEVTRSYYAQLAEHGPQGRLAVALFRALKRSKTPTGVGFRRGGNRRSIERYDNAEAYDWALKEIVRVMLVEFANIDYAWGWRKGFLYVDLPNGAVRFPCAERGFALEYKKKWWQKAKDANDLRVIQFCDSLDLERPDPPVKLRHVVAQVRA